MKDENKIIARLIKQIQRGKQSAFEDFYKLTSPKAYFIALKITQNEHDAEDILQESYIKTLEKINEIDTSQNITSWFLKIVANKSKDLLKSRNRFFFEGDEEAFFDDIPEEKAEFIPEENLDQEELRHEVMAAIDELTEEKRACIMMMYFGEMSVKEIAESIEVPESTVKNRLYTARKDLRTKFEKSGNILYGAALGGVLIWALQKTSVTASAAFAASAASANILADIGASAAYSAATTAAATATGIGAKVAALSVVQKVVVGVTATAVIGGGSVGVATIVKTVTNDPEPTTLAEEVTTAPFVTSKDVFNEILATTAPTKQETSSAVASSTLTNATTLSERSTKPVTTAKPITTKAHTTKKPTTTQRETTTKQETTTRPQITTQRVTTTVPTTRPAQTTRPTTTRPVTTTEPTAQPTTQPTTQPTAAQPTTAQAKATVTIDIIDYDGSVADTIVLEVEAGTTLSNAYIVTAVREKGYEPMAGVYGDIDAVAESGKTYKFEAEL